MKLAYSLKDEFKGPLNTNPPLIILKTMKKFDVADYSVFAELVEKDLLESIYNGKNFEEVEKDLVSFKMLKDEVFITSFTSFLTFQRAHLSAIFEKFILEAHQHGIIDYCYRQFYNSIDIEKLVKPKTKVLTFYMLSAGFYIWLASVGIACLVFICEHVKFNYIDSV